MKAVKFYGNIMVSVRWWCKADGLFIFPEVVLLENGFIFVWLKFTLKIVHIKLEKYEKGGEV